MLLSDQRLDLNTLYVYYFLRSVDLCIARKFFSKSALINLYYAFIFPYLIYYVEVWGNALSTHTQPLIKLQNKIIRINSHFLASSEKLFTETGILPFVTLVEYRIGLLFFKLQYIQYPFQYPDSIN